MRYKLSILLAALVLLGCQKTPEPVPVHEYTPQEQAKEHLLQSFSPFIERLEPEKIDSITDFLLDSSKIDLDNDGYVRYRLIKKGLTLITIRFRPGIPDSRIEAYFYGGVSMKGTVAPTLSFDWKKWDDQWDIDVYDGDEAVAKLGLGPFFYTTEEKTLLIPVPVFRFPDETSYSISVLVFTEAFINYLLENVISTE